MNTTITLLGVRGSTPVSGTNKTEFGGATSSVLFRAGGQAIFLDAGTGIINAPETIEEPISILITHYHIDHLQGLAFFPTLMERDRRIDLYWDAAKDGSLKELIDRLFVPPLWPLKIEEYPADVHFNNKPLPLEIGGVRVEGIESNHPGGSIIYKLTYEGRSFVYATDYEYDDESAKRLIDFARGTDLLLLDSQYTEEEYAARKGFGHSTLKQGMKIIEACKPGMVRFVHHDPRHDDEFLRKMEKEVATDTIAFAREGEEITL